MQSKKLCFNKTLIRHNLGHYWPVWAAYAIIWIFLLPLPLLNNLDSLWSDPYYMTTRNILQLGLYGGTIMSAIFGILAAMAGFNYLYNIKSSSFMNSLPLRRSCLFFTQFFTWLGALLAINVIVFLMALGAEAMHGAVNLPFLLQWLAITSILNVLFFGFAVFCAMLTGNSLVLPILYAVLNFTVYVMENIVRTILTAVVYGLSNLATLFDSFSPIVRLLNGGSLIRSTYPDAGSADMLPVYQFEGFPLLLAYLAAGLLFTALAYLLYRKRAMESATDVVAVKVLRPIFKYCFTFGCSLVIGFLLYSLMFSYGFRSYMYAASPAMSSFGLGTLLIFGAFIGYFAASMLLNKTFRVFKGNWPGFLVSSVVLIALLTACELDFFGYERRIPDSGSILSVSVQTNGWNTEIDEKENIEKFVELHGSVVKNKAIHEKADQNSDTLSLRVTYTLNNGKTLSRRYTLSYVPDAAGPESEDAYRLNALFNTTEAVNERKEMDIPVTESNIAYASISYYDRETATYTDRMLTPEEAYDLYTTAIVPDVEAGRIGLVWLISDKDYYARCYDCRITIEVSRRLSDGEIDTQNARFTSQSPEGTYVHDELSTYLTTQSVLTEAWIRNLGIDPVTMGESVSQNSFDGKYPAAAEYGYKD